MRRADITIKLPRNMEDRFKNGKNIDATTVLVYDVITLTIILAVCLRRTLMATIPTQIRIDEKLKKQSTELFNNLGLDMSGAVTMFLKQCVLRNGLPFAVEMPHYKQEVLEAMAEAKALSGDPSTKKYKSFDEVLEDLRD